MGDAGCFSFYATKNITTGDGGMVITRSKRLCERVRLLSLHGMSADAWTRMTHGANEYQVREAGFKYNMTDMAAALGSPQLAQAEDRWKRREQVWRALDAGLKDLPLRLPVPVERGTRHAYHLYTPLLMLESLLIDRSQVLAALRAENILAGIHYVPVHVQPYFRKLLGHTPADFPQAAFVGIRTISLPLSPGMSAEDVSDVCTALARILRHFAASPGSRRRGSSRARGKGIVKREPRK
jgi:dTDP-4-amino-4,6-dideoxygalactose transaminase